ncbi:hypothetical protein Sru01_50460 [Sphaerisporangium rufum]|uniref:Uncharacterized protein n=1 Tax=Sphaerisporangium rufum TaxID=1381558 RepID=A0A919R5K0_9ACTN|nr:DUF6157 family protein [Sphaerisporangium rufum]GII80064.1 hypothetical protein Sru01_50460 [Sphaerisporangium rufum]
MDLHYYDTLIAVADDCPVPHSEVPRERAGKRTVAGLQYEMLADAPHTLTQEDVLFESWLRRQDPPPAGPDEVARLRHEFFARSQACLRASPLPKRHGFGLLFDSAGRIALCPMESARYQELLAGDEVTVLKAMRSRRA